LGAALLSACALSNGEPQRRAAAIEEARLELFRLPAPLVRDCRTAQRHARFQLLCPSRVPRASRGSSASSALPPPELGAAWRAGARDLVLGLDFSYSFESDQPQLNGPERFLHFEITKDNSAERAGGVDVARGTQPASLGGKPGRYAPAGAPDPSVTRWPNHAYFYWTEHGVKYYASLHDFGPNTKRLLSDLVAGLRPARALRVPRRGSTSVRVRTIPLPVGGPVSVAVDKRRVWVAGQGHPRAIPPSVVRIDSDAGRVVGQRIRISHATLDHTVAVAVGRSVWIAQRGGGRWYPLRRLDRSMRRLGASVRAGRELVAVAADRSSVWAVSFGGPPAVRNYQRGTVARVDQARGRVVSRTRVGRAPAGIAAGMRGVWVSNNLDNTLSRINPRTNRVVATIDVGSGPVGVAIGQGAVWVANSDDRTIDRIDPKTNRVVATIGVGRSPRGVAVGAGGVWVTNYLGDTVSRINPRTNRLVETIRVGAGPQGIAVGAGFAWVTNSQERTVTRIKP
jgi:YVTN family beta-propeller protein